MKMTGPGAQARSSWAFRTKDILSRHGFLVGSTIMSHARWASLLMILALGSILTPVPAQEPAQDTKNAEAVQRVHQLLNQSIETAGFREEQSLRAFLEAVERRL